MYAFSRNSSALDRCLGREKSNNHRGQGRGAPFGGSGWRSPLEGRGVRGRAAPPPPATHI